MAGRKSAVNLQPESKTDAATRQRFSGIAGEMIEAASADDYLAVQASSVHTDYIQSFTRDALEK